MRLLIPALILTAAVAVTASVFAIWPVVADAPWENDVPIAAPPIADNSEALRCQGALDYRAAIVTANPSTSATTEFFLQRLLDDAEREITRYC